MIIETKSLFSQMSNVAPTVNSNIPFINTPYYPVTMYQNQQPEDYQKVMRYIKRVPECLAIFNAIAIDIASDGVYFVPHKKQGAKSNIEKAQEWITKNKFKSHFKAGLIDWLMLGNAGWWMGLSKQETKEFIESKGIEFKEDYYSEFSDLRQFQHVAWSTMTIDHDSQKINSYIQRIGTGGNIVDKYGKPIEGNTSLGINAQKWNPESIIHAKFMSFDGRVYGYTPTFSLMPVISTHILLKDYLGNYFENGGVPDWMFILPTEIANSPNVKKLEQMISEYKGSTQKHGNMVIPGDVKPVALNQFNKDMEFRALAVYYTAVLGFSFNMPYGRMQSILGLEVTGKDSDLGAEAYWRTISEAQDYFEDLFNSQLFIPFFGVELKFKKAYKQDQIRESQNYLFLQTYVQGMDSVLYRAGKKKFSMNYIKRIFQLEDSDLEDSPDEPNANIPGNNNQNTATNETLTGTDQQTRNQKRTEQAKVQERKKVMSA